MEEITIGGDTILYRRLVPAQVGEDDSGFYTSANAYKYSKKPLPEVSVHIAGMMTRRGKMTPELCAHWQGRADCGTGELLARDVLSKGFKIVHTVWEGELESHALITPMSGEMTLTHCDDLAEITKVIRNPDKNRKEIPPLP